MLPNPLARLVTDHPDVEIRHVDLGERWEQVCWEDGDAVIYLHRDLHERQARTALVHGIEHVDRGEICEPLRWQIERAVEIATARWLIPDADKLGAVLAAYDDLAKVAWEFWVPPFVVKHRLRSLTDEEWVLVDKHREGVA
jgi:hypothetical protein